MRMLMSLLLLGLAAVSVGSAAPEARESALRWKLQIEPDRSTIRNPAGRMTVQPRKGRKQVYWYLVYTIKNPHDEAVALSTHLRMTTDASDEVFHEGYYPLALAKIRSRFGDDVKDSISLKGYEIEPGETIRAVAVFQLFQPGTEAPRPFEERADKLTMHVGGYADVVKRMGQQFVEENLELQLKFEKPGDQYDASRESMRFLGAREVVVEG